MAIDWDDLPLSPWEQQVIAAMEDEFGRDDPGISGRAGQRPMDRPGPLLFIGAVVAAFGTVLAFGVPTDHTPLPIAGYILMVVGFMIVWEQLSPGHNDRPSLRPAVRKKPRTQTAFRAKQNQHKPGNVGGSAPPDPGGENPFG